MVGIFALEVGPLLHFPQTSRHAIFCHLLADRYIRSCGANCDNWNWINAPGWRAELRRPLFRNFILLHPAADRWLNFARMVNPLAVQLDHDRHWCTETFYSWIKNIGAKKIRKLKQLQFKNLIMLGRVFWIFFIILQQFFSDCPSFWQFSHRIPITPFLFPQLSIRIALIVDLRNSLSPNRNESHKSTHPLKFQEPAHFRSSVYFISFKNWSQIVAIHLGRRSRGIMDLRVFCRRPFCELGELWYLEVWQRA